MSRVKGWLCERESEDLTPEPWLDSDIYVEEIPEGATYLTTEPYTHLQGDAVAGATFMFELGPEYLGKTYEVILIEK